MSPLNWQESTPHVHPTASAKHPAGIIGFLVGIMSGAAFSFLLMGLIVGYILGNVLHR